RLISANLLSGLRGIRNLLAQTRIESREREAALTRQRTGPLRTISFALLIGACCWSAACAAEQPARPPAAQAPAAQVVGNRQYVRCRTPDGRWVWVESQNVPQAPAEGRQRAFPRTITSYPNSFRPQKVFGIDWYLNGRGPFSD